MKYLAVQRVCLTVMGCFLANAIAIDLFGFSPEMRVRVGTDAQARSSGGRSGGGSFRSSPSRSSSPSYSSPSSGGYAPAYPPGGSYQSSPYGGYGAGPYRDPYRYNRGGGTVIVPVPIGPPSYTTPSYGGTTAYGSSNDFVTILGLLLMGGAGFALLVAYLAVKAKSGDRSVGTASVDRELDNNIITVSKIQVALLAQAREIQADLTKFSLEIDTDTQAGLYQLMQESILALLRSPENWSHVLASSQTVKTREAAEALFNQISVAERSKFSVETVSNIGGKVYRRDFKPDPEEDPASYIVVTLVVGTAHDRPLFDQIQTESALKESLQKLAAIPADYLMVFELLWSPQDAEDSLTYDELLTEYTDMAQI